MISLTRCRDCGRTYYVEGMLSVPSCPFCGENNPPAIGWWGCLLFFLVPMLLFFGLLATAVIFPLLSPGKPSDPLSEKKEPADPRPDLPPEKDPVRPTDPPRPRTEQLPTPHADPVFDHRDLVQGTAGSLDGRTGYIVAIIGSRAVVCELDGSRFVLDGLNMQGVLPRRSLVLRGTWRVHGTRRHEGADLPVLELVR